jgi:type IV secretory pathway VirB9-like protein
MEEPYPPAIPVRRVSFDNTPLIPVTPPPPELAWQPPVDPVKRLGLDGFVSAPRPSTSLTAPPKKRQRPLLPLDAGTGPVRRLTVTPRQIVRVPVHATQPTYLLLPEGERLAAPLALNEQEWLYSLVEMGQGDSRRETVVVQPLQPGLVLKTGVLFRSGLFFFLSLEPVAAGAWMAVECVLASPGGPVSPAPALAGGQAPQINLAYYDDQYTLSVLGKRPTPPPWMPSRVFSDDRNTFVAFPSRLGFTHAPVAYGIQQDHARVLVEQQPYLHPDPQRGQLLMLKGLWPAIDLQDRAGQRVRIVRHGATGKGP